jgi:hypothetical protein
MPGSPLHRRNLGRRSFGPTALFLEVWINCLVNLSSEFVSIICLDSLHDFLS